jgi:hypothetical protein
MAEVRRGTPAAVFTTCSWLEVEVVRRVKRSGIHAVWNIWIQRGDFRGVRAPSVSPG